MTTETATTTTRYRTPAIVFVLAIVVIASAVTGRSTEIASGSPPGEPAPEFTFEYFDGGTGSLADFAGQPVVLNFWASWCPACVAEMPDFQAVHEALGDDVVFLGMDMQDIDRESALALIESTGVDYVLGDDPTGEIFQAFGGFSLPTTVFINERGEIIETHNGTIFADDLTAKIGDLLHSNS